MFERFIATGGNYIVYYGCVFTYYNPVNVIIVSLVVLLVLVLFFRFFVEV